MTTIWAPNSARSSSGYVHERPPSALEQTIASDSDVRDNWAVYADFLLGNEPEGAGHVPAQGWEAHDLAARLRCGVAGVDEFGSNVPGETVSLGMLLNNLSRVAAVALPTMDHDDMQRALVVAAGTFSLPSAGKPEPSMCEEQPPPPLADDYCGDPASSSLRREGQTTFSRPRTACECVAMC